MKVSEAILLASEYYERGGDVLIECWEASEIQELLDEKGAGAKDYLLMLFENWNERREATRP